MDVYGTDHAWYVLKSQFERRLPEVFSKIDAAEAQRRAAFVATTYPDRRIVTLHAQDILYLERRQRLTHIVMAAPEGDTHPVLEKLSAVLDMLPEGSFGRCHNSFAVSHARVLQIDATELELDDGTRLPVSRSYAKRFREGYLRWAASWAL